MLKEINEKCEKGNELAYYYELGLWRTDGGRNEPSYRENYNYGGYNTNNNNQYYEQQRIAGRPVYSYGAPPPPPVNAARQPGFRRRESPVETFDEEIFHNSFNTRAIRHRFIRKVYCILFVLLGVTSGVIALFIFEENTNEFARRYVYLGLVFLIVSFVLYIAFACVRVLRRKFPINLILLIIYTMFSSIAYGFVAASYAQDLVLYSAAITTGVCLLITLIACQPWVDITGWGVYLCIFGMVVLVFGFIAMIVSLTTGLGNIMMIIYSSLIALVFSMYFMYTTQLIIGGKKYEMSPEEYLLGAILLYVEIMALFMTVLRLFGAARG